MTIHRLYTVCVNKMYLHWYTDTHIYFVPVIFQIYLVTSCSVNIFGGWESIRLTEYLDLWGYLFLYLFTSIDVSEITRSRIPIDLPLIFKDPKSPNTPRRPMHLQPRYHESKVQSGPNAVVSSQDEPYPYPWVPKYWWKTPWKSSNG